MFCPDCNHNLQPIIVPTKSGKVILDYCPNCAGFWTDHAETNFFEASDLATILPALPTGKTKTLTGSHVCPHDRTPLEQLEHESVPPEIIVAHCPTCSGNWFPKKQLEEFKKAQTAKITYHKIWKIPLHSIYAILLPVLVVAILTGGLFAGSLGVQRGTNVPTQATQFISNPIVIPLSQSDVSIIFTTQGNTKTRIKIWETNENEAQVIEVSANVQTNHLAIIRKLKTQTTYFYRIISETADEKIQEESNVYQFTTR